MFAAAGDTDAAKSLNYTPLHEAMNTSALNTNGITKRERAVSHFEYFFDAVDAPPDPKHQLLYFHGSLFAGGKVALWMS